MIDVVDVRWLFGITLGLGKQNYLTMKKLKISLAVLMLGTLAFTNINAQMGTDAGGQSTTTDRMMNRDNDDDHGNWGLLGLLGLAGLIPKKDKHTTHVNTNNPNH